MDNFDAIKHINANKEAEEQNENSQIQDDNKTIEKEKPKKKPFKWVISKFNFKIIGYTAIVLIFFVVIYYFYLEKFDLVIGYRDVGNRMPRVRRWGNLIAKKIVKTLFGIERKDMLCGFFAFKMSVFPKIRWKSSRYGVETEIAVRVVKSGLCFKEIKVDTIYINKYKGVSIFDAVRILMRLPYWYFGIKK